MEERNLLHLWKPRFNLRVRGPLRQFFVLRISIHPPSDRLHLRRLRVWTRPMFLCWRRRALRKAPSQTKPGEHGSRKQRPSSRKHLQLKPWLFNICKNPVGSVQCCGIHRFSSLPFRGRNAMWRSQCLIINNITLIRSYPILSVSRLLAPNSKSFVGPPYRAPINPV